jgi:hypothetical protein
MSKNVSHKRFKEILDELVCDQCDHEYCFLKKFIESLHPEPIVLRQLKCIEMFKWEKNKDIDKEMGWNDAANLWASDGYASAFRKIYDEDLSIREVYKRTIEEVRKAT